MPTFFHSTLWTKLKPHVSVTSRKTSARLEFKVPPELKQEVEAYRDVCPSCGLPVAPLRFREKKPGKTNRIYKTAAVHRYYYAPNCVNDSCFRSKPATVFQKQVSAYLGLSV